MRYLILISLCLITLSSCDEYDPERFDKLLTVGKISEIEVTDVQLPIDSAMEAISHAVTLKAVVELAKETEAKKSVSAWYIHSFKQKDKNGTWWKFKYESASGAEKYACVASFDEQGKSMPDKMPYNGCWEIEQKK